MVYSQLQTAEKIYSLIIRSLDESLRLRPGLVPALKAGSHPVNLRIVK